MNNENIEKQIIKDINKLCEVAIHNEPDKDEKVRNAKNGFAFVD